MVDRKTQKPIQIDNTTEQQINKLIGRQLTRKPNTVKEISADRQTEFCDNILDRAHTTISRQLGRAIDIHIDIKIR